MSFCNYISLNQSTWRMFFVKVCSMKNFFIQCYWIIHTNFIFFLIRLLLLTSNIIFLLLPLLPRLLSRLTIRDVLIRIKEKKYHWLFRYVWKLFFLSLFSPFHRHHLICFSTSIFFIILPSSAFFYFSFLRPLKKWCKLFLFFLM